MKNQYLFMKWEYEYDKEGTWFDKDNGEEKYEIQEGAIYALPHINKKHIEIVSVVKDRDTLKVELYVDYQRFFVESGKKPVLAHASDSYSVCGDSVHQSLSLAFSIK